VKLSTLYFAVTVLVSSGPIAKENAFSVESVPVTTKLAVPAELVKPKFNETFVTLGRSFDALTEIEIVELPPFPIVSGLQLPNEFNVT